MVKTSYEYVTELRERLEDSSKLAQEELLRKKSQKRYKKHCDRKPKPRCLEVGEQVLILLPTDSKKLIMQWRGPYTIEGRVGANDYRIKIGSKTEMYHVNMLKKYIARKPEVDVVHTSSKDDVTIAVTNVIYQDTGPELGEVPSLQNEVDSMLEMGVVRPSTSPYASPIVMVKKKDGSNRLCVDGSNRVCVDFRKLNKITEVDPEPMTTAEDPFRRLNGMKYLSKIDLAKAYWQIPAAPEDVYKTAFVTADGQYEFLRLPYGIVNSGATLVCGLKKVLKGFQELVVTSTT